MDNISLVLFWRLNLCETNVPDTWKQPMICSVAVVIWVPLDTGRKLNIWDVFWTSYLIKRPSCHHTDQSIDWFVYDDNFGV